MDGCELHLQPWQREASQGIRAITELFSPASQQQLEVDADVINSQSLKNNMSIDAFKADDLIIKDAKPSAHEEALAEVQDEKSLSFDRMNARQDIYNDPQIVGDINSLLQEEEEQERWSSIAPLNSVQSISNSAKIVDNSNSTAKKEDVHSSPNIEKPEVKHLDEKNIIKNESEAYDENNLSDNPLVIPGLPITEYVDLPLQEDEDECNEADIPEGSTLGELKLTDLDS